MFDLPDPSLSLIVVALTLLVFWQLVKGAAFDSDWRLSIRRDRTPVRYWLYMAVQGALLAVILLTVGLSQEYEHDDGEPSPARVAAAATESAGDALERPKESLAHDPDDFEAHRQADLRLARQGRWDEILEIWDAFIARNPDHAGAYLERGGANYHKGDLAAARADAAKACELGLKEACAHAERLRGR